MKLRTASTWAELHAISQFVSHQLPTEIMLNGFIVGQYEMLPTSDLRPCGIANCSRAHRHGFIVELADGCLSNVGRDCGRLKFGARWNQLIKRYRAAKKTESLVQAVETLRRDARALLEMVVMVPNGLSFARERLGAFDALPNVLRDSLTRRAQSGADRIMRSREPTREEVDRAKFHGKKIPTRTEETIGVIRAIKAVAPNSRADLIADVRLPQRVRELSELVADSRAEADAISAKIRALNETQGLLRSAIARTLEFFVPENYALFRHLDPQSGIRRISADEGPPFRIRIER
jgi:hypothetical protein